MTVEALKKNNMAYIQKSPFKTINFSQLKEKINQSKFGKSKLGQAAANVSGKIGNVQKKFVDKKKELGLDTSRYDATVEKDEETKKEETSTPKVDDFSADSLAKTPVGPRVDNLLPGTPGTPMLKRVTRRTYSTRRKRK
mgnify:CR=1 FL=1